MNHLVVHAEHEDVNEIVAQQLRQSFRTEYVDMANLARFGRVLGCGIVGRANHAHSL